MTARSPSFLIGLASFGLTLWIVDSVITAAYAIPAQAVLLVALRILARREGRDEGELKALDIDRCAYRGDALREASR